MHSIPGREPPKACRSQRRARRAARADAHGGEGGAPTQRAQSRGWPKAMAPPWRKVCGTAQHHHNDQNATECESNRKSGFGFSLYFGRQDTRRQRRAGRHRQLVDVIACRTPLPGHSVQREPTSPHVRRENSRNKPGTSSTNNLNALTCAAVSPRTSHHPPNCRNEQDHSVTVSASRATTHKHSTPRRRHPTATPPQAAEPRPLPRPPPPSPAEAPRHATTCDRGLYGGSRSRERHGHERLQAQLTRRCSQEPFHSGSSTPAGRS